MLDAFLIEGPDFASRQARFVTFSPGPPNDTEACFRTVSDDLVECNETLQVALIVPTAFDELVDIDPNRAEVTIVDDDGKMNL